MNFKSDHNSSVKSTDSKKNIKKKISNAKIINGICNTAFTLEEKLQSKGYSNFKNLEDASTSTVNSRIDSPSFDGEKEDIKFLKSEDKQLFDCDNCVSCKNADKSNNDNECDYCSADNRTLKESRKNSDLRVAVQHISCIPNNTTLSKCNKCSHLPDYVQQSSAAEHKSILKDLHPKLYDLSNCSNCHPHLDEHNVDMPSTDVKKTQSRSKVWSALKGITLAFLSSIFFSLTAVIVKYMKDVDAGQMAIYRFAGMLLFVLPIVTDSKQKIFGPSNLRHWILLRGLAGASSLYLRYSALHYLPISNATVIVLSMPVFVCIFGKVFLNEACGLFHVFALAVTLVGIAFTSKLHLIFGGDSGDEDKNFDRQSEIYGLISGLGATLVGSSAYIIVRKVKELHYSVILFNFAWVALLESFVITYSIHDGIKVPQDNVTPWLLMGLGILSFYGQMLLTRALQAEEAALVSVTRSASEVFFAFLFQILIFQHMPTIQSIIGATLVTSAVMLTSVRKYVINLPDDHLAKRIFRFTLK